MSRMQRRLAERRRNRRLLLIVVALFLILLLVAGLFFWWLSNNAFRKVAQRTVGGLIGHKRINIAVMGLDERPDDPGRTDTLFVVNVDPDSGKLSVMSIPRDTRVSIPGRGWDKINHAYAYGGHELTSKALANFLGIPIDYYIVVNFKGFIRAIDDLGGVMVDVDKRMYYYDPWDDNYLEIDLQPGRQLLDGRHALEYVRYRDEEGDIGRVRRQQEFITELIDQATTPQVLPKLPGIAAEVYDLIETDLSLAEMVKLAKLARQAREQGLSMYWVPGVPRYIDGVSYWLPDIEEVRKSVAQMNDIKVDAAYNAQTKALAERFADSVPGGLTDEDFAAERQSDHAIPELGGDTSTDRRLIGNQQAKPPAAADNKEKKTVSPPSAVKIEQLSFDVQNGSGVSGQAAALAGELRGKGLTVSGVGNGPSTKQTTVIVHSDDPNLLAALKTRLGFSFITQVDKSGDPSQVTIVIGKDFRSN
ncbi:MAG: LCP family protein [Negativicutes bacterium]|nr:LCP family protein [Negativicutes bacterium]